jgi:hypothetical protein
MLGEKQVIENQIGKNNQDNPMLVVIFIWSVWFSILPFSIPFSMTFFLCLASLIHFSRYFHALRELMC